jgi:putative heme-binding domain-containing protein
LVEDPIALVRRAALESLRHLENSSALAAACQALDNETTQPAALAYIAALGGPAEAEPLARLARNTPSAEILPQVAAALSGWRRRSDADPEALAAAIADLQAAAGVAVHWSVAGPLGEADALALVSRPAGDPQARPDAAPIAWESVVAQGAESQLVLVRAENSQPQSIWVAASDVSLPIGVDYEFTVRSNCRVQVWLDGQPAAFDAPSSPGEPIRFNCVVRSEPTHIVAAVAAGDAPAELSVRFRGRAEVARHEDLIRLALAGGGDVESGKALFFDEQKSKCARCHKIGDRGQQVGPDLSAVGDRFSRIHVVESILQPNRAIGGAYQSMTVAVADGRTLSGVRVDETDATLTLVDSEGQRHMIDVSEIDERGASAVSTMPEGLEKVLSDQEFLNLVEFLMSQRGAGQQ